MSRNWVNVHANHQYKEEFVMNVKMVLLTCTDLACLVAKVVHSQFNKRTIAQLPYKYFRL